MFYTQRGDYAVHEGQIFVIRPSELTTYTADKDDPWHYCWVGFQSALDLNTLLGDDVITAPECAHIFRALIDSQSIHIDREWYVCGKIYELLSILHSQTIPNENETVHYIRRAQNYIETNFERELSVAKLAQSVNLDRAYFSKQFKRYTGKSPQSYIVDFRLKQAAELMVTHGFSPGEAAKMSGYSDGVNFSRMFKRKYGVSPSVYSQRRKRN